MERMTKGLSELRAQIAEPSWDDKRARAVLDRLRVAAIGQRQPANSDKTESQNSDQDRQGPAVLGDGHQQPHRGGVDCGRLRELEPGLGAADGGG